MNLVPFIARSFIKSILIVVLFILPSGVSAIDLPDPRTTIYNTQTEFYKVDIPTRAELGNTQTMFPVGGTGQQVGGRPLVIILHGNNYGPATPTVCHPTTQPELEWCYPEVQQQLAALGFIVVNTEWDSGLYAGGDTADLVSARDALEVYIEDSYDRYDAFLNDEIVIIGHSVGGAGAVRYADFVNNYHVNGRNLKLKSIVSIAPAPKDDDMANPKTLFEETDSVLFIYGGEDKDISGNTVPGRVMSTAFALYDDVGFKISNGNHRPVKDLLFFPEAGHAVYIVAEARHAISSYLLWKVFERDEFEIYFREHYHPEIRFPKAEHDRTPAYEYHLSHDEGGELLTDFEKADDLDFFSGNGSRLGTVDSTGFFHETINFAKDDDKYNVHRTKLLDLRWNHIPIDPSPTIKFTYDSTNDVRSHKYISFKMGQRVQFSTEQNPVRGVLTLETSSPDPTGGPRIIRTGSADFVIPVSKVSEDLGNKKNHMFTTSIALELLGDVDLEHVSSIEIKLLEERGAVILDTVKFLDGEQSDFEVRALRDSFVINERGGFADIELELNRINLYETTRVHYDVFPLTATIDADFIEPVGGGVVEFAPGEKVTHIRVPIVEDHIEELSEEFRIDITSVENALLHPTENFTLVEIVDNDFPGGDDRLIFEDDFETNKGWTEDPDGTDTAFSRGVWERANPEGVNLGGWRQQGATTSGVYDLVTGALAGVSAGDHDIDGGHTSILSPTIQLPYTLDEDQILLRFEYYFAYLSNATSDDYFKVTAKGEFDNVLLDVHAVGGETKDAIWQTYEIDITPLRGHKIKLHIEAADNASPSLVEAAVDDVYLEVSNEGPNLIKNGNFDDGSLHWIDWFSSYGRGHFHYTGGDATAHIENGGNKIWSVGLGQQSIPIVKDKRYRVNFRARSSSNRSIQSLVGMSQEPYEVYSGEEQFQLTPNWQNFSYEFTMTHDSDSNSQFEFDLGLNNITVDIDDVELVEIR